MNKKNAKSDVELEYLDRVLSRLSKAKKTLDYSYNICKDIGVKDNYTEEEKDRFESLSSKFARLSDLIFKQAFKTIYIFELEDLPETMRDSINRAEKKELIQSAATFIEIRKMRNKISHEYVEEEDLLAIYKFVYQNTPIIMDSVDRIQTYCQKFKTGNH